MSTTTWSADELRGIGAATELQVASYRQDGSLRPYITIWTVAVGDAVYIRSAYGPGNGWFRRAIDAGSGRIRAGGVERDVEFHHLEAGDPAHADIDAAYHSKYDQYGQSIVGTVTGEHSTRTTLQADPLAER
ncbi:DUF2255 family protein [Saccharopolyspora gloriosae]|uniref:DUF2255 family protein n=1 Tax=Saccharopolyspora gloriosae TaxID=455344 RepID=UPI001FB6F8EA|nr:DUF2255 family protein [Saccharopolyspora gloriosae]